MTPPSDTTCDVAIIGAGVAGTAAAVSLSRRGLSVQLIDLQQVPGPAFRAEKFSADQLPLLTSLGLLDPMAAASAVATRVVNIRGRRVIDRKQVDDHGLMYRDMVTVLRDQLPPSIRCVAGKATALELGAEGGTVRLGDGRSITARLVVLATGHARALRDSVGIARRVVHPTPTSSIAFTLHPPSSGFRFPSLAAYGEVTGDGVDYTSIFPVGDTMRVNVFVFAPVTDPRILAFKRDPMAALLALQPGLAPWLEGCEAADAAVFFAMEISICDEVLQPALVLIGDAYRTSCPSVGNGLSCLMVDVERLQHHAARWMQTPGMRVDKIAEFYRDPLKASVDQQSHRLAVQRRRAAMSTAPLDRARRAIHFGRRRAAHLAVALAALLGAVACTDRQPANAAVPEPGATVLSCTHDATHALANGVLINNTWNQASAGAGPWRQCLQSRVRDGDGGGVDFGWFWEWPTRDGLYAYPEILIGRSPWRATPTNDTRFPRTIADTRALWVDYDVESRFTGKRNLAAEFWLTRDQPPGSPPDPRAIRNELMIWTEASEGLVSAKDKPVGIVEIDGVRWAVHVKPDWGDASGGVGIKWQMISYHALTPTSTVRYDARKFFQDAIDRGWLQPGDTIEGIELGNELVSGSGSTWVRKFSLDIQ